MNTGIVLTSLAPSQASFLEIANVNSMVQEDGYDFTVFIENVCRPYMPINCSVMNTSEMWSFDGLLITNSLLSTLSAIKVKGPSKTLFYVNDLEWLRNQKDFIQNLRIYRSVDYLVARSQEHAMAIQNYSNRTPDAVIEGFDIRRMVNGFHPKLR
jgi:hypothetical protein